MIEFKESKFYKLLQDFSLNNDKETFLQLLAEFYNRTEGIIDKNIIQDDLIKELRELYIKFNEEGIDDNIVREKVNYFVENNEKIQDIIAKIIRNTNNIKNITSQLDTIENKIVDIILDKNITSKLINDTINGLNGSPANIIIKNGTWTLEETVFIPYNVSLDAKKSIFMFSENGNYVGNYMFLVNSNDARTWTHRFMAYRNEIKNFFIRNRTNNLQLRGMFCATQSVIKNIEFDNLNSSIVFGIDETIYLDTVELDNIRIIDHRNPTNSAIIKNCAGDGWYIKKITFNTKHIGADNLLTIRNSGSITIDTVVNGGISFEDSVGYINNIYLERGYLKIIRSSIDVNNLSVTNFKDNSQITPIQILGGTILNKPVTLNNVFIKQETFDNGENSEIKPDILISKNANITFKNVFRHLIDNKSFLLPRNTDIVKTNYQSPIISIQNSSGTYELYTDFNFKPSYSIESKIINGEIITDYNAVSGKCGNTNIYQGGTQGWKFPFTTYYYKLFYILDDKRRILSDKTNEISVAVNKITESDNIFQTGICLEPFFTGRFNNILVYRGNESNSYNRSCTIPAVSYNYSTLHDNGNRLGCFPWIPRTSGPLNETYNTNITKIIGNKNNIIAYGTSVPSCGSWSRGDRIYNTEYTLGTPKSWYCYASGTPGSWKEEDVLN